MLVFLGKHHTPLQGKLDERKIVVAITIIMMLKGLIDVVIIVSPEGGNYVDKSHEPRGGEDDTSHRDETVGLVVKRCCQSAAIRSRFRVSAPEK